MKPITIEITILKSAHLVWAYFTKPEHITAWHFSNDRWICPKAESDLQIGGTFNYRMEAQDGSFGFDYNGTFDEIIPRKLLKYHLEDGRNVEVVLESVDSKMTKITETFEPDPEQPEQMQREGWYGILNNFHKYAENIED
jgi:uncharacterized protein YndB with AHSA1/START domain